MNGQAVAAELMRATAYSIVALALIRLFRRPQTKILGRRRWLVVMALLASGGLQLVMLAARGFELPGLRYLAQLADAGLLLGAAIILWPFLDFSSVRLKRMTRLRLRRHVREARAQAAQARRLLELGEEMSHAGHWTIAVPDKLVFWSDEIYRICGRDKAGYTPAFATVIDVFHDDDRGHIEALFAGAIIGKSGFEFEARLLRPDGEARNVVCRGAPELNPAGEVTGLFGVFMDVTGQKKIQEQLRAATLAAEGTNHLLRRLALVDSLTGLPNRRHFDVALASEFRRAIREQTGLGVIMIDLDHFKGYNDLYGHPAGDECLRRVAAAIGASARRPGDLAARYGGEEFAVLLPHTDAAGVKLVAAMIIESVAALLIPHLENGPRIATVSCGTAVFQPGRDEHAPLALLRRADQALYAAKRAGRNCVAGDAGQAALQSIRAATL
jgi:diguanylate cyclase (GGDEF)-like protein